MLLIMHLLVTRQVRVSKIVVLFIAIDQTAISMLVVCLIVKRML